MNKQILSMALVALMLQLYAQSSFAQASGVKPELLMYRHNSSSTSSPTAVVAGNILGTVKWNGLTDIGAIRTGATIRSVVKNVSPGSLAADLIFSTGNGFAAPIPDRMIIRETGLVGIGTMDPQYHLHVEGNTHTSGDFFGRIHMDNNPTDELPGTYVDEAYFERKGRATLGLGASAHPNGGTLTFAPGLGSIDRQLFMGDDAIWTRSQHLAGADSWAAWQKLLTSADIKGTPNRIARFLPPDNPSSTLGDSQIFDDGTDVGIGTVTPDAAYLLTIGGDTRVSGDVRTDNNLTVGAGLNVTGNAAVAGNTTSGSLDVTTNTATNSLQVTGNTNTGSLQVNTDATVSNNCRVNGQLVVGNPAATPGSHELYVNGSIIAEEVSVKLQASWPDYVFEPAYDLQPLATVEQYIQENKHLPGIVSAREVAAEGLALGQMQQAQMEKIEELYLHLIALEKRVQQLETENQSMKSALEAKK